MKQYLFVFAACAWAALSSSASPIDPPKGAFVMTHDGLTEYRIVISASASPMEKKAAEELQKDIKKVSGAYLSISTDRDFPQDKEILVGESKRLRDLGPSIDIGKFDAEGFTIRTVGNKLVIVGGPELGTLYGVYTFLEEVVGCRWFAEDASYYPEKPSIVFGKLDMTQIPKVVYRNIYYAEARNPAYNAHQKINGLTYDANTGGKKAYPLRGSFNGLCHTVFSFVPPDQYFAKHPEYFSLRDGKRTPSQLCLTNPDVVKIVVENLKKAFAKNPKFLYCNVSQMDNGDPCTCDKCKAIDDREGGYSGTNIEFVNKVAAHFPNKIITTLAYWYTMGPPKTVKPAKNVLVIYCADTDRRPPFDAYYNGWVKITPKRWHWYYVNPCHNPVAPWPNFFFMARDLKEWADRGMTGIFVEGINESCSEFAELRTYLIAKLLWDPHCNMEQHLDEFLKGYYGAAAPSLHSYIYEMNQSMMAAGDQLNGHDWCKTHATTFLAPNMLARYEALFDQAEQAVEDDPVVLKRIHKARIPLMHAEMQLKYGTVDYRLKLWEKMKAYTDEAKLKFYADFGERPAGPYLEGILADLKKEKG